MQNSQLLTTYIRFKLTKSGPQIWPLGLYHTHFGYFVICAPLPHSWTEEKEERKRMEGREEGRKVRTGLVSSIPGEKRELHLVTGGGKGPEYHNEIKHYIMVILTFDV